MLLKIRNILNFLYLKLFGAEKYARKIGVEIGRGCRIYTAEWGSEPYLITLGDKVTVSKGVIFITHDGAPWIFENSDGRYYKYAAITIGNNVFIGMNSILMPGINIGNNVIIGSGSVVTKSLNNNAVYAGNPAIKICDIDKYRNKVMERFCHSASYINILNKKERILAMVSDYKRKTNVS